jgi:hypothetical protein
MNSLRLMNWLALALAGGIPASASSPVEIVPPELRGATQPQVAVSAHGEVYVVFGRDGSFYCAASPDGGRTFKRPVLVGSLTKAALGRRRGPRVAATDRGVVVSAISHGDGNVVAWHSSDQGATWSPATRINSVTNAAREGLHAMTGDGKGTIHAAWLDLRSGKTELWGASSPDGGRTWSENHLVYKSPDGHICECCHPSLAVDGRGRLWAMWRNWLDGARDMYASVSKDGGRTFSAARKLGDGTWTLKACPMDGGQLAFGADGSLLTVWRRDKAIVAAGETGESVLSEQGLQPVVGVGNGAVFQIWERGPRLMVKKGSAQPAVLTESGAFPAIASASAAAMPVAVWESTRDGAKTILAQRLE